MFGLTSMRKKGFILNEKIGNLVIVKDLGVTNKNRSVLCKCYCGEEFVTKLNAVRTGKTKSCGCLIKDNRKTKQGQRYGRWTLIEELTRNNKNGVCVLFWKCLCDCGTISEVASSSLLGGDSQSCGCLNREILSSRLTKHNMSTSKLYRRWTSMKARCDNPKDAHYHNYGGRGITVCARWKNSFENFYNDMGEPPEDFSLDRIDVNGNYEPDNCRWTDRSEQNYNTRKHRDNTSGYTGISWDKVKNKWSCRLYKDGVRLVDKYFKDIEEAIKERLDAEIKYYGYNVQ